MAWEILTPVDASSGVTELSGHIQPRFRKQIMRMQTIDYRDRSGSRRITFDRPYLRQLVRSFKAGAYDQVPYQIADPQNGHNNDPERFRGELIDMELTDDGIDGIFEPTSAGAQLLRDNPKLGVSCRIVENLTLPDGRHFPKAIQHVLGTVNPQLQGMRPWQQIDLSYDGIDQTLDLSGQYVREEKPMPEGDGNGRTRVLELSEERAARLEQLLDDMDAAGALAELVQGGDEQDGDSEDDETESDGQQDGDLESRDSEQFALLSARQDAADQRVLELTQRLRNQQLSHELDNLRRQGLSPAILDAAAPLLALPSGAIELSSPDGQRMDPAEVLRGVLQTVVDLSQQGLAVVQLDTESGYLLPGEADSEQTRRNGLLASWDQMYGR